MTIDCVMDTKAGDTANYGLETNSKRFSLDFVSICCFNVISELEDIKNASNLISLLIHF